MTQAYSHLSAKLMNNDQKLKVALYDDKENHQKLLEQIILKWAYDNGFDIQIEKISNIDELINKYNQNRYECIFLDRKYEGSILDELVKQINDSTEIIFFSNANNHIIEGYHVTLQYFKKQISSDTIIGFLDKWNNENKDKKNTLLIKSRDEIISIHQKDIVFIESDNHSVNIHTNTGSIYKASMPLKKIDDLVSGNSIIKCHRAFMINLAYVHKISRNEIVTENGDIIPLSKKEKDSIIKRFVDYQDT